MLTRIAKGVLVHESGFLRSNCVVVEGPQGALLVDAGLTATEMACLASDLRELGQPVAAGFSTHPHWDHVLWHADLGSAPRYGTVRCVAAIRDVMSAPDWQAREAEELPPEIAEDVPLDLYGLITGVPAGSAHVPWAGPRVRIIEHEAHAPGHAALLIADHGVLVAGDMLSDELIPFLDLRAADPIEDYLTGVELLEEWAGDVDVLVPGHGSVGGAEQLRARIELDRAYVRALRDGRDPGDPRLEPSAAHGEWLPGVHAWQLQQVAGSAVPLRETDRGQIDA